MRKMSLQGGSTGIEGQPVRSTRLRWTSYAFLVIYTGWLVFNFTHPYGYDEYGWGLFLVELPVHLLLLTVLFIRAVRKREARLKYGLYSLYVIIGFCTIARYSLRHWYGWW